MIRAVTSASNVDRRALCPGSERLETGLPDDESDESREGDLLHACDANPQRDRATLTPDQRDLLKLSADLEAFVFERAAAQFGIGPEEPYTQGNEEALWLHKGIRAVLSGHCDKWRNYHRLRLLLVVDKKYGYRPVTPAAANLQLRAYACMGAEQWQAENVVVAINQPRLPYEERVTLAIYTAEDVAAARTELFAILEAAKAEDAPLVAGEQQCRWCKAKMICPAYKAKFLAIAEQAGRDLAVCTDDQLSEILVAIQFADFIADKARDEARARVASGTLPTWKLGKASELRKVVDPERALALLTMGGTLTREEVLECSTPSLKKLETKVREKTGCAWAEARQTIDATLAPVLERSEKKPSLVRVKE